MEDFDDLVNRVTPDRPRGWNHLGCDIKKLSQVKSELEQGKALLEEEKKELIEKNSNLNLQISNMNHLKTFKDAIDLVYSNFSKIDIKDEPCLN
ncbi:hypothetical protein DDB_G0292614 [Dictyostelium discoideum AX4]|uniref:Putative uncharacterized protein DDB_G0292614 n=1 Tax=Dictyostelium discoideum TaxID=44689 RepID=Y4476_DICDI|nr:hypothetical protein DDB_G0292614 [Dictyostelium discoideum AX4]Q54CZ6.1 RecName: Full=Putative uncharacterized protein DDB_G0292614 [Dictyostelium discoideum]EAL61110.1 hypothetical protein DDB_G0292614 [Dictyostelium discoideum AX4]|eukprot:XP_629524.1 hypothetical protein DDB_G0292614 [Dictyostelium discoideum AX4]